MSDKHSFLALDWVKGEIEETLKQARQALEAFVENPEDEAQMRFCLAYLHQVLGTLQMVEFYGAALLAEEMEALCQALIAGKVARVADGQEVLMRAILQLPPYLERVKESRRDLPVVLLPLLNDIRAVCGESLLSETALFAPDLSAGERAPIQMGEDEIDPSALKRIRQAYQLALLGVLRNEALPDNLNRLAQVFSRLEKTAGASPLRELWQIGAALVEGVAEKNIDLGTSVKMLLGQIDRQLRTAGDSQKQRTPVDLLKNLLYYIAKSSSQSPRIRAIKDLYRLDDALPGDALVNEERARMSGPDREAMKSVVDALCEELARVKDALDIFVRKPEADRNLMDLSTMVPMIKQVADTVAVLGLGQPRRILQEQIEVIDRITSSGNQPADGTLLDIAGALLYVEATLMGMVAEKPLGQVARAPGAEFSAQDQLSDAQAAVLRESRSALEKAKDAVVEYIASQWNPEHLSSIPELIDAVRGSLTILSLHRPVVILTGASSYVTEKLLTGEHRPDWQEMDTLADIITSVEYYLERIANDTHGGEGILDIAERGLNKLGYSSNVEEVAPIEEDNNVDEGGWNALDEAAFETSLSDSTEDVSFDAVVETQEDEVLQSPLDDTSIRMAVAEEQVTEVAEESSDTPVFDIDAELDAALDWQAEDVAAEPTLDSVPVATSENAEPDIFDLEALGLEEIAVEDLEVPEPVLEAELEPEMEAAAEPVAEIPVVSAEPPKKPILPVLTNMPVDDFDFDEEIREIFVEEVEEVMQNIGEYFPRWAANFEDTEALLEFRRGFHTLKGSGRMVGAKVVGELAWAIENMLNKVRDKVLVPDQVMVNVVSEALALVPDLVDDFWNKNPPRYNTSGLMAAAESISRGETLTAVDVARAAELAQGIIEAEVDNSADFDALAASLTAEAPSTVLEEVLTEEVPEPEFVEPEAVELETEAAELPELEVSADIEADQAELESFAEVVDTQEAEEAAEAEVDPFLVEIFTSEAETHQETIAQFLASIDPDRNTVVISDELLRSLHTLKGSAGMAGISAVAELAAPLEHLFKDLRNQTGKANRNHVQVLRESHDMINASITNLHEGGNGRIDGQAEFIAQIRQLDQDRIAALEKEQNEKLGNEPAAAMTVATQGLVARFMELGIDNVLDASWELEGWLQGDEASGKLTDIQNELQQLRSAADETRVEPLAQLCERMQKVYVRIQAGELSTESDVLDDLLDAHEEIVSIFDTLAASQTVQPNERILSRLTDAIEAPAVSAAVEIDDEPEVVSFEVEQETNLAEQMTDADGSWQEHLADSDQVGDVDPELLEIFLEEADEVLEAAQGELENWRHNPDNTPALAALQRHLHTLKGGARLAEIRSLGNLAHELEFLYEGLVDGRYASNNNLVDLLQRCHDRLADMVSELREQSSCSSGLALINEINAYRRQPSSTVVDDEPTSVAAEVVSNELLISSEENTDIWQSLEIEPLAELPVEAVEAAVELPSIEADTAGLLPEIAAEEISTEDLSSNFDVAVSDDTDSVFAEFFPDTAKHEEPAAVIEPAPVVIEPVVSLMPEEQGFDPELLEIFMEEAAEIIDATSEQLATWKSNPDNLLPVQELQRGLHTLKGGARMAEITALGDLSHHMENLYEAVCDGLMKPTPVLFGLLQRCHDRLAEAVDILGRQGACPETGDLIQQIQSYIVDPDNFQETPSVVTLTPVEQVPEEPIAAVEPAPFIPRAIEAAPVPENVDSDILEIFQEESEELAEGIESSLGEWLENRNDSTHLEALLRHLHTLKGGARLAGLKDLGNLAHDWETELVPVQNGTQPATDQFFEGQLERLDAVLSAIKQVRGLEAQPAAAQEESSPTAVVSAQEATVESSVETAPVVRRKGTPPSMQGGFRKDATARGPQEMIRVPSDLLEQLVNLAGETSIARSRVEMGVHGFAQTVEEMGSTIQRLADQLRRMDSEMETQIVARHNEETGGKYEDFDPLEMDQYSSLNQLSKALAESASDLLDLKSTLLDKARDTETLLLQQSRINTELQEGLMRSRMVPFSRLVPRLKRIVRQIGQETGKPAELDVINPEGEMDRTLLERIVAPLEHMLRNAVDHGLEDAAARAASGKPAQGNVSLTLSREGGDVVLVLADDGRGINVEAVRKKALERGLIQEGQDIPDQEIFQFIFHAGFSTAAAVTQISGRGVGMDVVQSEIKQMGGVVSIHSVQGKGTTFTIRLPFTVAVNRALMVRVGEDIYAVPLSQIEGIVRASSYELETYYGPDAPLFEYAGVAYRLNYLGEFVHDTKSPNLVGQALPLPVLLIRGGDQHIAIQVDQLIGSREIVVKAIGAQLASVAGISGATILGDGSVVIILDVVAMLRAASLTRPQALAHSPAATLASPASDASRTKLVMVVDDSVTVRKVTSRLLERHGYDVLLAKDGMDAISKLEDARPDVMLLDIEMPRMDGFEVASLVRHNPNLEDLPIIMITSRTGEKHRERAFQIGVNCYMGKPFQEEELLSTISELLAASVVK